LGRIGLGLVDIAPYAGVKLGDRLDYDSNQYAVPSRRTQCTCCLKAAVPGVPAADPFVLPDPALLLVLASDGDAFGGAEGP